MNITKVSVIIPVYNVEAYLRQCLDSVVNQALREIEIICVDDGSTDGSSAFLTKYAVKNERTSRFRARRGRILCYDELRWHGCNFFRTFLLCLCNFFGN